MNKILVVLGTAREDNKTKEVANFVNDVANKNNNFQSELVDISSFLHGKTAPGHEDFSEWKKKIADSVGVIFVSPEYNHSFPGELKILIDSLYDEYKGKIAGIVGVSAGTFAGARMIEQLKIILHTVNFDILLNTGNVGPVSEFDSDKEKYEEQVSELLEEMSGKL